MADDLTTTRVAVCGPMSQGVEYHVHDAGCPHVDRYVVVDVTTFDAVDLVDVAAILFEHEVDDSEGDDIDWRATESTATTSPPRSSMATPAERQAAYRLRKGATPGAVGRPATQPCGTVAAYKRHLRRREPTCEACRAAWANWHRDRSDRSGGDVDATTPPPQGRGRSDDQLP